MRLKGVCLHYLPKYLRIYKPIHPSTFYINNLSSACKQLDCHGPSLDLQTSLPTTTRLLTSPFPISPDKSKSIQQPAMSPTGKSSSSSSGGAVTATTMPTTTTTTTTTPSPCYPRSPPCRSPTPSCVYRPPAPSRPSRRVSRVPARRRGPARRCRGLTSPSYVFIIPRHDLINLSFY